MPRRRKNVSGRHKSRKGSRVTPRSPRYMLITDCPGCPVCDAFAASAYGVWRVWDDGPRQAESPGRDGPGLSFDQAPVLAEEIYGDHRSQRP